MCYYTIIVSIFLFFQLLSKKYLLPASMFGHVWTETTAATLQVPYLNHRVSASKLLMKHRANVHRLASAASLSQVNLINLIPPDQPLRLLLNHQNRS